jgi:hypothetical protein
VNTIQTEEDKTDVLMAVENENMRWVAALPPCWAVLLCNGRHIDEMEIKTFATEPEANAYAWKIVEELWLERAPVESFEEFKAANDNDIRTSWVACRYDNETLHVAQINWPAARGYSSPQEAQS